jgi:hypothetical protein
MAKCWSAVGWVWKILALQLHVPLDYRLPSLTTVRVPDGVEELAVRQRLATVTIISKSAEA